MSQTIDVVDNDKYAEKLARAHFQLEPGISLIAQLESSNDAESDEPLKLLEVNSNSLPMGLHPVQFPPVVDAGRWHPSVIILEVAPEEFKEIQKNPALLPNGWRMGRQFKRTQKRQARWHPRKNGR
ncbi:MAG TPA: hypothetical protein VKX17_28530 [Planctomycetota bacterium]|nr:hypothetical protein [Planctomycetota bacterium]